MKRWVLSKKGSKEELRGRELETYDKVIVKLVFATPPANPNSAGTVFVEYPDESRGTSSVELFNLEWRYVDEKGDS